MIRRSLFLMSTVFTLMAAATAQGQAAATVCKDGSSSATSGRGACSGHGGVDAKATKAKAKAAEKAAKQAKAAEKKADKAEKATANAEKKAEKKTEKAAERAEAKVICADGSQSKGGRGACSGHGGVRKPNETAAASPSLPAAVPVNSPARTRSEAKSKAASASRVSSNRADDDDATGAIAQCKDGKYSHAANHQGACSRHGGVSKFLKG